MARHNKKKSGISKDKLMADVLEVYNSLPNQVLNYKQVAAKLGYTDGKKRNEVIKALGKLAANNKLLQITAGKFKLNVATARITGVLDVTRRGDAFLVAPEQGNDIFISKHKMGVGLHGDEVEVLLKPRSRGKSAEGVVVGVVKRHRTQFVGTLDVQQNFAFFIPDNPRIHVDFYIPKENVGEAKNGQKVVVELKDWPDDKSSPFGKVVQVLGEPGEHNVEMNSILVDNGFPVSFPPQVEADAARIPLEISEEEIAKRLDFRGVTTFTIDPVDAKDFDDALSLKAIDEEWYQVGVHIADVTHYVHEKSNIEKEAVSRATSVYLVDRVVPMLPEVLSNQVCSLRPNEDKLCYSAIFTINLKGEVKHTEFARTIIHSVRRFTYEEAQEIIETGEGELAAEMLTLHTMAQALRKKRFSKGGVTFDKIEVRFSLNEQKQPVGVFLKVQKEAHKLIEDFMLLANKKVAEFIGKVTPKQPHKRTFVYRIHDTPNPEKVAEFTQFISRFGYKLNSLKPNEISSSLNELLEEIKDAREANIIETMAIRTMAKAVYSTQNIGHYGLGFEHYTHFTSPIRRYPDMMVHRLLTHYLQGGKSVDENTYEQLCKHSSDREREAADAERDSVKYFQVLYMKDAVGKQFKGFVSGMNNYGIFVELEETRCEGMIRLGDMSGDVFYFDERKFRMIGHNSQAVIHMGDALIIEVVSADLLQKRLEFKFVRIAEQL